MMRSSRIPGASAAPCFGPAPGPSPLADTASGRVSMPFLPTLVVIAVLGAASLFCPTGGTGTSKPKPVEAAMVAPLPAFAEGPAAEPRRVPATLAFAQAYPFAPQAQIADATPRPPAHEAVPGRTIPRLAVAAPRRPCPGKRCPEFTPGPALPPRAGDPIAAQVRPAPGMPADDGVTGSLSPLALPFAAVADAVAPATRAVGEAADLVRGGAAKVSGAVTGTVSGTVTRSAALLAECLP